MEVFISEWQVFFELTQMFQNVEEYFPVLFLEIHFDVSALTHSSTNNNPGSFLEKNQKRSQWELTGH